MITVNIGIKQINLNCYYSAELDKNDINLLNNKYLIQ